MPNDTKVKEPRICTDGEWPCEMSTYIHAVEYENIYFKDFMKELRIALSEPDKYPLVETIKALDHIIEEYPDFIRARVSLSKDDQ